LRRWTTVGNIAAMKIACLIFDKFTALDVIGPYEVLSRLPGAELSFVAKET
jgi:putative intracellular protease/amidase